jgi:hypothetical protein
VSAPQVGLLLGQLYNAETALATEYRTVAERQAAEHDVYYMGRTLAAQCDQHAETVRNIAQGFGKDLPEPSDPAQCIT